MYGNSEDVLMLGLKQYFIGKLFYFGVKATYVSSKDNFRIGLADVIKQKHSACQNLMLTQESRENTNIIAYQMVPAFDREMRTVYDIIRNFFKDSTDGTAGPVEPGSEMYTNTSVLSSIQQSQSDIASLERSRTNHVEHSSVTLGQTTALLSCEMSEIENSNVMSASKSRNTSQTKYREICTKNDSTAKLKTLNSKDVNTRKSCGIEKPSKLMCTYKGDNHQNNHEVTNGQELSTFSYLGNKIEDKLKWEQETDLRRIIPPSQSESMSISKDKKQLTLAIENMDEFTELPFSQDNNMYKFKTKQNLDMKFDENLDLNAFPHIKIQTDYSSKSDAIYLQKDQKILSTPHNSDDILSNDSQPIFSQEADNTSNGIMHENTTIRQIDNSEVLPSITETWTDNFDNNHGGTFILPNIEVLDMPENVPHSEGLDIYLFDDSCFDTEFGNEMEEQLTTTKSHDIQQIEDQPIRYVVTSHIDHMTCSNQSVTKSKMGKTNDRDLTIFASKDGKGDEIPFNNAKSQETYNMNIESSIKPLSCQVDINQDDFDDIFGDSFDDYENSLHKLEFDNQTPPFSCPKCIDNRTPPFSCPKCIDIKTPPFSCPDCIKYYRNMEEPITRKHCLHSNHDTLPILMSRSKLENVNLVENKGEDIVKRTTNLMISENVSTCALDFSQIKNVEFCPDFEHSHSKEVINYASVDKSVDERSFEHLGDKSADDRCFEHSGDLFLESQFTEYDKSSRNMLQSFNGVLQSSNQNVEYYSDLIFESQQADLQQEEMTSSRTENENGKFESFVSESIYLDGSEDLFGEISVVSNACASNCEVKEQIKSTENSALKTSKKCIRFSHCLSNYKSVQLIDLQMKLNLNSKTVNKETNKCKKSCLKQTFEKTVESNKLFTANHYSSRMLNTIENSPILDNNSQPFSQDMFSPSPVISFKLTKPIKSVSTKYLFENAQEDEKSVLEISSAHYSTPIEHNVISSPSVFSESFQDEIECEQEKISEQSNLYFCSKNTSTNSMSSALFSQSCSLFSYSNSNLSKRGDNFPNSNISGGNSKESNSVNYSYDLFSPSGYKSINSLQGDMPVKRLFLDKL